MGTFRVETFDGPGDCHVRNAANDYCARFFASVTLGYDNHDLPSVTPPDAAYFPNSYSASVTFPTTTAVGFDYSIVGVGTQRVTAEGADTFF